MTNEQFTRKKPARGVRLVSGQPTVVFDTVCTKHKKEWMGNEEMHRLLIETWQQSTAWLVGRYVVMPDHIHYFAWATESEIEFESWVKYWKSQFARTHGYADRRFLPNQWDTRMRSESGYEEKWIYVFENPVRAGLVEDAKSWPFQGVVHDLRW